MNRRILIVLLICCGALGAQEDLLERLGSESVITRRAALREGRGKVDWKRPGLRARLRELVADEDPLVREMALEYFVGDEAEKNRGLLRERIAVETSPGPRREAVKLLGPHVQNQDALMLRRLLEGNTMVAAAAIEALVRLGYEEDYERIEALLEPARRDGWLCHAVPRGLLALDRRRALPELLDLLAKDRISRHETIRALVEDGSPKVVAGAKAMLSSEHAQAREAGAALAIALQEPELVETTLQTLRQHPDERAALLAALGATRSKKALPALLAHLEDERSDVRCAVVRALEKVLPEGRSPLLEQRLGKETEMVALVALCKVIADLGDRRSVGALSALLDDQRRSDQPLGISSIWGWPWNVELREAAAHAILTLRDGKPPTTLKWLVEFPADHSDQPLAVKAKNWWKTCEDRERYSR